MDGMMEWRSLRRAGAVRAPDMIDDRYRIVMSMFDR